MYTEESTDTGGERGSTLLQEEKGDEVFFMPCMYLARPLIYMYISRSY